MSATLAFSPAVNALTLVDNGASDYVIVIPEVFILFLQEFAAQELASHIKQMSGADLKIARDTISTRPRHPAR